MTAPILTGEEVQRLRGDLPADAFGAALLNSLDWVHFVLGAEIDPRSKFSEQAGV